MTIQARYPGTCGKCHSPIAVGAKIEWIKGSRPTHVSCGSPVPAPAAPKTSTIPGVCHCGRKCPGYATCFRHSPAAMAAKASGVCVACREGLSDWERTHGISRCADCRDGGSRARGGMSYYDRNGNFVLGDDD